MARSNDDAAAALEEYAELFSLNGGDSFRVRSYQKAAKSIAGYPKDLRETPVRDIPGVGEAIALKMEEFLERGSFRQLDALREKVPTGVRQLTRISSLGPKKAVFLYQELGIDSPQALAEAITAGRLKGLRGFGPKTEQNLLKGIEQMAETRVHLGVATDLAERVIASLPAAERIAYAGSLRRGRETIGDIDILAVGPVTLMETFAAQPYVTEVVARGDRKTSVKTDRGLQVDLRVVPAESWGAALIYFTGSKDHNVAIREMAVKKGWKLSEYGLFDADDKVIAAATEEDVYAALGMRWVPPPLREDGGEVKAALKGALPRLVELADLKGDLHTHTNLTDGLASLEDMVAAGAARGYRYYAVTDHAPDLVMQRMTLEKMRAQRARLAVLQEAYPDMRLLHGTELNIGPDGTVDWPEDVLAEFDVCVASVHSHFTQSREDMTRRFITACENPQVDIIGHPTTRKIGRRPQVDADWDAVFRAAARTGTAMEIDAYPDRADLPSDLVRLAHHHGVKFSIDSDSHAIPHLNHQRYGVGIAQRAWLTSDDVINTWPLDRLLEFLGRA